MLPLIYTNIIYTFSFCFPLAVGQFQSSSPLHGGPVLILSGNMIKVHIKHLIL